MIIKHEGSASSVFNIFHLASRHIIVKKIIQIRFTEFVLLEIHGDGQCECRVPSVMFNKRNVYKRKMYESEAVLQQILVECLNW